MIYKDLPKKQNGEKQDRPAVNYINTRGDCFEGGELSHWCSARLGVSKEAQHSIMIRKYVPEF